MLIFIGRDSLSVLVRTGMGKTNMIQKTAQAGPRKGFVRYLQSPRGISRRREARSAGNHL